jgi:hypothetical protein
MTLARAKPSRPLPDMLGDVNDALLALPRYDGRAVGT